MKFWPRFLSTCRRRHGDVFTLRVASLGTVVYLARPADIKAVFGGDPAVFHAGEANSMLAGLLGSTEMSTATAGGSCWRPFAVRPSPARPR